jgi:Cu(I)/Ag(I) efflux system periplasmic protein CusF
MAGKGWVSIGCLVLALIAACGQRDRVGPTASTTPTPSATATTTPANTYQGVGVVKSIDPKVPAIEIDHEDIVGLMQGMQMEFPVTDAALLNGLAVNDRVDFTIDNGTGEMKIIAIKKK